jgi:hypothetical protein
MSECRRLTCACSNWFNDLPSLPASPKLASITLRGTSRLDAISFTLKSGQVFSHGGTGGNPVTLMLNAGETIKSAKLCWGTYNVGVNDPHTRNFYALLTMSAGRTASAGTTTTECATATTPVGFAIVGAYGQDGDKMDQVGWIYAQQ